MERPKQPEPNGYRAPEPIETIDGEPLDIGFGQWDQLDKGLGNLLHCTALVVLLLGVCFAWKVLFVW